jgi:hypothetical protein
MSSTTAPTATPITKVVLLFSQSVNEAEDGKNTSPDEFSYTFVPELLTVSDVMGVFMTYTPFTIEPSPSPYIMLSPSKAQAP